MQNRSIKVAIFNINGVLNQIKRGENFEKTKVKIQTVFRKLILMSQSKLN